MQSAQTSEKRIVYLWAEVPGYVVGVAKTLSLKFNCKLDIVYWDKLGENSTRFQIAGLENTNFHKRTTLSIGKIVDLLIAKDPQIIVISGWMDKDYIAAAKKYKVLNNKVKVVAGIDDQWTGSFRQILGTIYYKFFYRRLFDFMWISGKPQFSYAQRFGYNIENIITELYSADTDTFTTVSKFSKRFVFVGRFDPVKALDIFIGAYNRLPLNVQEEWPLLLIGDGEHSRLISESNNENIVHIKSMQPDALKEELLKGGVGCLTSHKDQWGVVVHEFALLGFPLLLSSGCGAATEFLIAGFNGFLFNKSDEDSLLEAMLKFSSLSDEQLSVFANNSVELGKRINNELSAASLISILDR